MILPSLLELLTIQVLTYKHFYPLLPLNSFLPFIVCTFLELGAVRCEETEDYVAKSTYENSHSAITYLFRDGYLLLDPWPTNAEPSKDIDPMISFLLNTQTNNPLKSKFCIDFHSGMKRTISKHNPDQISSDVLFPVDIVKFIEFAFSEYPVSFVTWFCFIKRMP